MTSVRQMKYEGLQAERKRRHRKEPTLEERMEEQGISEADRDEVRRFARWLNDSAAGMPLAEQIDKHGADYLGFTSAEVETIRANQNKDKP